MEPVRLPLLSSVEEGIGYLLLPGFEEDEIQGVEYQVDWDRAVIDVYVYEGEGEDQSMEGVRIPVIIDEDRMSLVRDMTALYVVEPRRLSPGLVGEDDYVHLKEQFEDWKSRHY